MTSGVMIDDVIAVGNGNEFDATAPQFIKKQQYGQAGCAARSALVMQRSDAQLLVAGFCVVDLRRQLFELAVASS